MSLVMSSFDRAHMISYSLTVVVAHVVSEIFNVEKI